MYIYNHVRTYIPNIIPKPKTQFLLGINVWVCSKKRLVVKNVLIFLGRKLRSECEK